MHLGRPAIELSLLGRRVWEDCSEAAHKRVMCKEKQKHYATIQTYLKS